MSQTTTKRDCTIRCRAETELKEKLARIASKKRKRFSEYMRDEMWKIVAKDEATGSAKKSR